MSAVHQRVRRLEQRGLITGYRATLDAKALGPAADGVRLDHADRRRPARRRPGAAGPPVGDRGVPLGRRRGELHPQGAGGLARRAGAPAAGHPRGGERHHPDDGRALHLLRGPPADLTARRDWTSVRTCVRMEAMRWDAQRLDLEDPSTLPGMPSIRGLLRSVAGARVPRADLPRGAGEERAQPRARRIGDAVPVDDQPVPGLLPFVRLLPGGRHARADGRRQPAADRRPAGRRPDRRHRAAGTYRRYVDDRGAGALVDGQAGPPGDPRRRHGARRQRRPPVPHRAGLEARHRRR